MTTPSLQKVDHSALKINQVTIIILNLVAFTLNLPIITVIVAAFLGIGSLLKIPAFGFIYKYALKPWGWVKPDVLDDNPEPHRFAQNIGFLFETAGAIVLYTLGSVNLWNWTLIWIMVVLPALNAFGGFCLGCAVYYWLGKQKLIPAFSKQPPAGTFPGMKPKAGGIRES
jgi:hypothetical protein